MSRVNIKGQFVYHEPQESQLCGQHCLNNLLQGYFFDAVILANIAQELDDQEKLLIDGKHQESANVNDSGNFSIQVLRDALERFHNIELVPWFQNRDGDNLDPLLQKGFVVNRSDHWFTIRKVGGYWWNLNSTIDTPELVTDFYLSALLSSLRAEGYSVFIATGAVPEHGDYSNMDVINGSGQWYSVDKLLRLRNAGNQGGGGGGKAESAASSFVGPGRRLGGDDGNRDEVDTTAFMLGDADEDDEEELMLAKAISASLETAKNASTPVGSKEEMRRKRLAALEKRGV